MAPREELITSAITFLEDPSVAAAPLEKRRAFLESKNLTGEEIDIAFARAAAAAATGATNPPASSPQQGYPYPPPQYPQGPPPYNYGYPPYPGSPWAQQAMEPPKRDWRDWFIMATVTSGVGYGLYQIGKRYVMPLIKPPTPEQLEQDKSDISSQFDRAFTLIEQLATDTEALKTAESERNAKLDTALKDVEQVISDLRTANDRREQENRRVADDVNGLRDSIPKALEGWKNERDARLQELSQEMKSLKTLMSNRLQPSPQQAPASPVGLATSAPRANGTHSQFNGDLSVPAAVPAAAPVADVASQQPVAGTTQTAPAQAAPSKKPNNAKIPLWQMNASKKAAEGENAQS